MAIDQPAQESLRLLYVDPVGGHRGMHYYDFPLCCALAQQDVQPMLVTCDETTIKSGLPFEVQHAFRGIYGSLPAWRRGVNYARGLGWVLRQLQHSGRIVHLHYFLVPLLDWLFVCALKAKGLRVVVTAHDVVPFNVKSLGLNILLAIYRLADRIIVHTEANRQEMLSALGLPAHKVLVIHHGPFLDFAASAPKRSLQEARVLLGLPTEGKVILFFGQVKRVKGLDILIRSFSEVLNTHPNSRLVIAGPVWKDDYRAYAALIDALQLGERVATRLEYIPDKEVPLYFQAADVVALPYRKVYQSGVLFMAHSFARPVVAAAVGGLAETIRDGETGYLVPPEDVHALAATLCQVLADPAQSEKVGQQGRLWVEEHYSWSDIAAQTAYLYRELLHT